MHRAMKRARIRAGLSIGQLSDLSGVSTASISNWENGVNKPTIEAAYLVAEALGMSLSEYLGDPMAKECVLRRAFLRDVGLEQDYENYAERMETDG